MWFFNIYLVIYLFEKKFVKEKLENVFVIFKKYVCIKCISVIFLYYYYLMWIFLLCELRGISC